MDLNKIVESLTKNEVIILKALNRTKDPKKIKEETNLKDIELNRSFLWLENKNLIRVKTKETKQIELDTNGKSYLKLGLPEKRFLESIKDNPSDIKTILEKANLTREELNISIGLLKKRDLIRVDNQISITKKGVTHLESVDKENFLRSLPRELDSLSEQEKQYFEEFKTRKQILLLKEEISKQPDLTSLGKQILNLKLDQNLIESLTTETLIKGTWKNKQFRRYDLRSLTPKIYPGKRHFVNQAIDYARKIWLEMGFKEMSGPIINPCFWNFDALFVPQDHPAREMQDTFYLKGLGKLPDQQLINKIKQVHEKGWNSKWDQEASRKLVLRTHTTVLSARTLAQLKTTDLPAKFFAIGRNYRNEALDWSHLFEFNQTEAIVVAKNVNFRHMLGYLKEFFSKMGFPKARFRPAYFPYTSLSTEIDVYHPEKRKWIELGGAGLFRPEVTEPLLGKDIQVLAWGPGFDRIILDYYKIEDIRDLYKNDLKKLREIKGWFR